MTPGPWQVRILPDGTAELWGDMDAGPDAVHLATFEAGASEEDMRAIAAIPILVLGTQLTVRKLTTDAPVQLEQLGRAVTAAQLRGLIHRDLNSCERCGENQVQAPHVCPYRSVISDDRETLCNCCSECELECALNV